MKFQSESARAVPLARDPYRIISAAGDKELIAVFTCFSNAVLVIAFVIFSSLPPLNHQINLVQVSFSDDVYFDRADIITNPER